NNELLLRNHQSRPTCSTPFPEVNEVLFERNGGNKKMWSKKESGKGLQNKPSKGHENICFRCGMKGHWSRTCRTLKHLVDLYQASLKEKGKGVEVNLA
ncbi:hypothetical protein ACB092_06G164900, partial [Castanea dentata]